MAETNLRIWSALETTSPSATKGFQRAGGFKGTAIKPIYTSLKMTETFGPCGIGWGVSTPTYELVKGDDGSVAVYCTVTLWFRDPETGQRSDPIPGVGGDFAIAKRSSGLFADDEAYKKAFTDAIGNAQKLIGMSADVHMGRFDDAKYVNDLKREEAAEAREEPPRQELRRETAARTHEQTGGMVDRIRTGEPPPSGEWEPPRRPAEVELPRSADGKMDMKLWLTRLMLAISRCERQGEPAEWLKLNGPPILALKENAPTQHKRLLDYAATVEREVSNPMAA